MAHSRIYDADIFGITKLCDKIHIPGFQCEGLMHSVQRPYNGDESFQPPNIFAKGLGQCVNGRIQQFYAGRTS